MSRKHRVRLIITLLALLVATAIPLSQVKISQKATPLAPETQTALSKLNELAVKGRAPKTGYTREQFGDGWQQSDGCDTRNIILNRDLKSVSINDECQVINGVLDDPYTGKVINFVRGPSTSDVVQIDHVVALSNAWQTGAQYFSFEKRVQLANDPLELLAVDGKANLQKSDGDAATWLPSNKSFRCQYVSRQVDVKVKYGLWVTEAEKQAIQVVLRSCV